MDNRKIDRIRNTEIRIVFNGVYRHITELKSNWAQWLPRDGQKIVSGAR